MPVLSFTAPKRRPTAEPQPRTAGWDFRGPELELRPPGVLFEWSAPPARSLPVSLETAALVGLAPRGPLFEAVEVTDWTQFVSSFGGYVPWAYLAYSAAGFFANGGRRLRVVRVDHEAATASAGLVLAPAAGESGERPVLLQASSPGLWGDGIVVEATPLAERRFDLAVSLPSQDAYEVWPGLTLDPRRAGYVGRVLNTDVEGSRLVRVLDDPGGGGEPPAPDVPVLSLPPGGQERLRGGRDGLDQLGYEDYRRALAVLARTADVGFLAMPDILPKPDLAPPPVRHAPPCGRLRRRRREPTAPRHELLAGRRPAELPEADVLRLQHDMVGQCETLRDRVALLDPWPSHRSGDDVVAFRDLFRSSYAAVYAPWLRVPDPLRGQGEQSLNYLVRDLPPSGYVAGVITRVVARRGPAKPPANEVVAGARDVTGTLSETAQATLNEEGVNLIRPLPGRGLRILGERTTSLEPALVYLNVRLLLIYVETRLEALLQDVVFEANGPRTWEAVERIAGAFLLETWELGWLDGATPEEAFFVTCDATTTTAEDVAAGRLICLVGLLPPWPAEFVTVRIGQVDGALSVLNVEEGRRGQE